MADFQRHLSIVPSDPRPDRYCHHRINEPVLVKSLTDYNGNSGGTAHLLAAAAANGQTSELVRRRLYLPINLIAIKSDCKSTVTNDCHTP